MTAGMSGGTTAGMTAGMCAGTIDAMTAGTIDAMTAGMPPERIAGMTAGTTVVMIGGMIAGMGEVGWIVIGEILAMTAAIVTVLSEIAETVGVATATAVIVIGAITTVEIATVETA